MASPLHVENSIILNRRDAKMESNWSEISTMSLKKNIRVKPLSLMLNMCPRKAS
jgi:hypothetical protein